MHGIAAFGILLFVVVLAVAGRAALSGTGPFVGRVSALVPTAGGLAVTIIVANEGTRAAATTCRLTESPRRMGGATQVVQAPLVPPGSTVEFTTVSTRFGTAPVALVIDCQSP
jgi:hypothetical protein